MSLPKSPLVSVALLTYNHKKYIRECLDSIVCQQTDFPFEVIVADDASTDGTQEIIREYADRYPDLIYAILREKNLGVSDNSIDMVKHCHGTYIASIEGDDSWCHPKKLQIQVDFLKKHPDYSGIFGWANVIDNRGNILYQKSHYPLFIFPKHTFTMTDFQLDRLPGQFSGGLYINIYKLADYNWEKLFDNPSPVGDSIITMMLCMNHRKYYVTHERLFNYRYIDSNTVGGNYFSTLETKDDLSLFHFRYYNYLETTMKQLTGQSVSLRMRKYHYFLDCAKQFKEKPTLSSLRRLCTMLKEEAHPLRMIVDGIRGKRAYARRYSSKSSNQ